MQNTITRIANKTVRATTDARPTADGQSLQQQQDGAAGRSLLRDPGRRPACSPHPPTHGGRERADRAQMAASWRRHKRARTVAHLDTVRRAVATAIGNAQCRQSTCRHGVRLAARAARGRAARRPVPARGEELHQRLHSDEHLQHHGQSHELARLRPVRAPLSAQPEAAAEPADKQQHQSRRRRQRRRRWRRRRRRRQQQQQQQPNRRWRRQHRLVESGCRRCACGH